MHLFKLKVELASLSLTRSKIRGIINMYCSYCYLVTGYFIFSNISEINPSFQEIQLIIFLANKNAIFGGTFLKCKNIYPPHGALYDPET